MGTERDRVISITLTEAEYRAFVAGTLAGRALARAWERAGAVGAGR